MCNSEMPGGWYKYIETCRSDYNINIVKIKKCIYCATLAEILKFLNCVFVYGIASLKLKAVLFDLHATDKYTYRLNTWNIGNLKVILLTH
jgi:hypothetical protein